MESINRALISSIQRDDTTSVRELLRQGGDPNAKGRIHPAYGDFDLPRTALEVALWWRFWKTRDIEKTSPLNLTIVRLLLESGACLDRELFPGRIEESYPLFHAVQLIETRLFHLLMEYKPNINAVDEMENTPLMEAVPRSTEMMTLLLERGANVNAQNRRGQRALVMAVSWCEMEAVRLLLDNGANADLRDKEGMTALSLALSNKRFAPVRVKKQIAEMLINSGAR